jgi:hypothetical protein
MATAKTKSEALNPPLTFNLLFGALNVSSLIVASTLGLIFLRFLGILSIFRLRLFFK